MHRKIKHKIRLFILLAVILALLLTWWINNKTYTITRYSVSSAKVSENIRIVQLSDLHGADYGAGFVNRIAALQPDLIAATGDMYSNGDSRGMQTALTLLSDLAGRDIPVYFVPGEHDNNASFLESLRQAGVHVMSYEHELLSVRNTTLAIYGIDNAYFSPTFDLANAFEPLSSGTCNILLAHIPNLPAYAAFGFDFVFSGDTHGGLIRFPFLGPLYYQGQYFPALHSGASAMTDKGIFEQDGTVLCVSGGLGNYPVSARLFNRPEAVVMTISP